MFCDVGAKNRGGGVVGGGVGGAVYIEVGGVGGGRARKRRGSRRRSRRRRRSTRRNDNNDKLFKQKQHIHNTYRGKYTPYMTPYKVITSTCSTTYVYNQSSL